MGGGSSNPQTPLYICPWKYESQVQQVLQQNENCRAQIKEATSRTAKNILRTEKKRTSTKWYDDEGMKSRNKYGYKN